MKKDIEWVKNEMFAKAWEKTKFEYLIHLEDAYKIIDQLGEADVLPKYYVDLGTIAYVAKRCTDGRVGLYPESILCSDNFEFDLTEQEIKDYDERFWPFAVKVEELEE